MDKGRCCCGALLLALAASCYAQTVRLHGIGEASLTTKTKFNLVNRWQQETGVSFPIASSGPWSLGANLGYNQTLPRFWKATAWTSGATLTYRLDRRFGLYSKVSTGFLGSWRSEHGVRATLHRGPRTTVTANIGYVHNLPFRSSDRPQWTLGVSVAVPVREVLKH